MRSDPRQRIVPKPPNHDSSSKRMTDQLRAPRRNYTKSDQEMSKHFVRRLGDMTITPSPDPQVGGSQRLRENDKNKQGQVSL